MSLRYLVVKWLLVGIALGLISLCGASEAFSAHNPTSDSNQPQKAPQPLAEGQLAPFSGMLVPYSTAAALTAKAELCDERIAIARSEEKAIARAEANLAANLRQNDKLAFELKLKIMQDALDAVGPGWWEHPVLWFGVGIVVSVATVAGAVGVLDATRPVAIAQ